MAVHTTLHATGFSRHWVLISAFCTVGVAFFRSNKDTWKLKRILIAFSSYFTCITRSLSISSAFAHSYTFRWLVSNSFPFFTDRLSYQLSEVGWSLSGFFLLIFRFLSSYLQPLRHSITWCFTSLRRFRLLHVLFGLWCVSRCVMRLVLFW